MSKETLGDHKKQFLQTLGVSTKKRSNSSSTQATAILESPKKKPAANAQCEEVEAEEEDGEDEEAEEEDQFEDDVEIVEVTAPAATKATAAPKAPAATTAPAAPQRLCNFMPPESSPFA